MIDTQLLFSLPILPPHNLLQPRSYPGADVALGGGDGEADGADNLFEVLGLKLANKIIPEGLEEDGVLGLALPGRCFLGKLADDAENVLMENGADGYRYAVGTHGQATEGAMISSPLREQIGLILLPQGCHQCHIYPVPSSGLTEAVERFPFPSFHQSV